jgi:hypothetical protein
VEATPVRYAKTCEWCETEWEASKPASRTCSPKCRALLREREKPSPGHKRDYPPEIVARAVGLYEGGATVAEVQTHRAHGFKAQTILERHVPERRRAIKREQTGPANAAWKGTDAGYDAAHARVVRLKGPAREHRCADCGGPAVDWSYEGGAADEKRDAEGRPYSPTPSYYTPRCRPCHRTHDAAMRQMIGGEAL